MDKREKMKRRTDRTLVFLLSIVLLCAAAASNAASVVSSSTTKLITNPDGSMIADFEYVLEDNNSVQHTVTERARLAAGTNVDAFRIARHPVQLEAKAHQEREDAIATDDGRCDYLFFEVSANNFIDAVPNWNIWMQIAQATSFYFWSREDMLEILPFRPCWNNTSFSSTEKKAVMNDISQQQLNDLNSAMANVTNIQTMLDAYAPMFDDEGNPLP